MKTVSRTSLLIILSLIVFASLSIPHKAYCEMINLGGQLSAGFGYNHNPYIDYYVDIYKKKISDNGSRATSVKEFYNSIMGLGFYFNLRLFYNNAGFELSSGYIGLLNKTEIKYAKIGDLSSPGYVEIVSHILPESLTIYYRIKLSKVSSLLLGIGPGYYLIYTVVSTGLNLKKLYINGNMNSYFIDFYTLKDENKINHGYGANVIAEFSYKIAKSVSFEFGFRGSAIFTNNTILPVAQLYAGITESSDF